MSKLPNSSGLSQQKPLFPPDDGVPSMPPAFWGDDSTATIVKQSVSPARPPTVKPIEPEPPVPEIEKPIALTLSALLGSVDKKIKDAFPSAVWVQAEIVELKKAPNGHVYLDLIERDVDPSKPKAKIRATIWTSVASKMLAKFAAATGSQLRHGMKVLLLAKIASSPVYGMSLEISDIDPTFTVGAMAAHVAMIKKQLVDERIFGRNTSLPKPDDFFRIAVVAPDGAAGLGDFKKEADVLHSNGVISFEYFTATFQGERASQAISTAIGRANDTSPDAIVVLRGGGAAADLQYLNDYAIAKSICLADVPVIVGIGHEKDKTLLDEVASVSCGTPSKVIGFIGTVLKKKLTSTRDAMVSIKGAAELLVAKRRDRSQRMMASIQRKATLASTKKRQQANEKIREINSNANHQIQIRRQRAAAFLSDVQRGSNRLVIEYKKNAEMLFREISGQRAEKTLARGFSLVKSDGEFVTNASAAMGKDLMEIQFSDGFVNVRVEK